MSIATEIYDGTIKDLKQEIKFIENRETRIKRMWALLDKPNSDFSVLSESQQLDMSSKLLTYSLIIPISYKHIILDIYKSVNQ